MFLATIDVLFVFASTAIALFFWRRGVGLGAMLHTIIFILFVPGLQALWRVESSLRYEVVTYIAAHVLVLTYLGLFNLCALWLRQRLVSDKSLLASLTVVRDGIWQRVLVAWIAWQGYLIGKYGIVNLYAFKYESAGATGEHVLSYIDAALNTMLTTIALGAVLIYIAKSVAIRGYWVGFVRTTLVGAFLAFYLVFGETPLGVRRSLMLLVLFALLVHVVLYHGDVYRWVRRNWRRVLLAMIGVVSFAMYYQAIRGNIADQEVVDLLISGSPMEKVEGILRYAVPQTYGSVQESTPLIRSGPFDLVYRLIVNGRSTNGELLQLSTQTVVPRVFVEDKPDIDVDDVIADRLGIVPEWDYLAPDLPTSVLSIFFADLGYVGVVVAAVLMAGTLSLLALGIPRFRRHPLVLLATLAVWFQVAGNVEGELVPVLAGLRDLLLLVIIVFPVDWVIEASKNAMKKRSVANHVSGTKP